MSREQEKRSYWIWNSETMTAECEECHYETKNPLYFCPMCGADKRVKEEEDDGV